MNLFQRIGKLFKDPKDAGQRRQPIHPPIKMEDIPAASVLLFYNGNKLTERAGASWYKHPHWPPAFHAALYLEERRFLNVGKFKTVELLEKELRSNRRVDVVIYKALGQGARRAVVGAAYDDTTEPKVGFTLPDYAITDYLRFMIRGMRPSKKDFCSENCAELLGMASAKGVKTADAWAQAVAAAGGIRVSDCLPANCAPWDLQEWAESHPDLCDLRTLHVGAQYPY